MTATAAPPTTAHQRLLDWVDEVAALCQPDRVEWCDGSQEEYDRLCQSLVERVVAPAVGVDLLKADLQRFVYLLHGLAVAGEKGRAQ